MTKTRVVFYIEEETKAVIDEMQRETLLRDDVPAIDSSSEIYRNAVENHVQKYREEDDGLLEVVDDETLLEFRHKQRKEETKPMSRGLKFAERFRDHTDQLMSGEAGERAHPSGVEQIAEIYIEDLEDHHRFGKISEESLEEQREAIETRLEEYREDYHAAQYAPPDRDVPDDAAIGRDMLQLRDQIEDVVERIVEISEGDAFDPDAIVDALSAEYAVSEDAIDIVLDLIVPDDQDVRRALKDGRDVEFREIMRDDALESADDEPALEGGVVDETPDHDHVPRTGAESERATIEIDSESEDTNGHRNGHSDEVIVVDGDRLRDVIDSEIQESETDPAEGST
jgi:hypothetical protein